jgi:aspartyl-tRNA(Asn)/glutamyl-tRNA(Gln) amidotransferase subunit B
VRTALAFGLRVNAGCRFARKHYYYPDMPKNFQISQYEEPLAEDGWLEIDTPAGVRRIGIQRLHLEEDVGRLVHEGDFAAAQASLVDYNRSGMPLMETVSRPDLRSPEEAAIYLRAFRAVLLYLGVCDGNMEQGSLRCDANISLRSRGAAELGTKVEIKNLNSFRNVQRALEYEVQRQAEALAAGRRVVQETRLFDADRGTTRSMRSKEYAHDYRYFPEPDLVPLQLDRAWIESIRAALPELPRAQRQRFASQYGLPVYDAEILTQSRALGEYYEAAVRAHDNPKAISNWIMTELLRELGGEGARESRQPRRAGEVDRRGHHQRHDRQGRVRPHARLGRGSGHDRAARGPHPGGRRRGPRGAGGPGDRRQPEGRRRLQGGQGGGGQGLDRAGHEGQPGQGQPRHGRPSRPGETVEDLRPAAIIGTARHD